MRKTAFMVFVPLAVLAAVACKDNPMGLSEPLKLVKPTVTSPGSGTTIKVDDLAGTWQAIKAEGTNFWDPNIRRDLVVEGGTITLVLGADATYTVTLTMPGEAPRVNYGTWHIWNHDGRPQIDFWPGWIPWSEMEYGDGVGFYITLSGNALTLSDGGGGFLLYDFGWYDAWGHDWAKLELVLTR